MQYRTLTVAREFGSGGGRIANTIAGWLGWKLLDAEIINAIARTANVESHVVRHYDERVDSWLRRLNEEALRGVAMATGRPEQVVGLHFFNPVPVLRLVEIITSLLTSPETAERARTFATDRLGKRVIASPDRAGFVVNALLIPYILSAVRMLESGFATADDIDTGMVEGCAHPMGPLHLADLIGLDTTQAVAESLYDEFKEPLYAAPPLLNRMVDAGLLGRKAGQGFYSYK